MLNIRVIKNILRLPLSILGSDKLSVQAQQHAELFLNIEVKMRLLELNCIPNHLNLPSLPTDLDWAKAQ